MQIILDGKNLDFTLEGEKKISEIIQGIRAWLGSNYSIMTSLEIDGNEIDLNAEGSSGDIPVEKVKEIKVSTISLRDYRYSQITIIQEYFKTLLDLISAGNRTDIAEYLRDYARIKPYLEQVIDRVYNTGNTGFIETAAAGADEEGSNLEALEMFSRNIMIIAEERKREITETDAEIKKEKAFFGNFLSELAAVSVLLQTGRDSEAFEKIIRFIDFAKKFSRLLGYYNMETGKIQVDEIANYNRLLGELGEALGRSDSVLTGDLLEYEITPVIEQFFEVMTENR